MPRPAARPASTRSGCSSSGRPRPSSRATSPPSTRATTRPTGSSVTIIDGGPTVIPQQAGSAADGPEFTISWVPKVLEAREGSPASDLVNIAQIFQRSGTLSVVLEGLEHHRAGGLRGQEGRRLGLRQRVRGHGRRQEGRARAGDRLREGHPAIRHDPAPVEADRRRRGDDLQRVRPGPRGEEPRDRQPLPARATSTSSTGTTRASRCSRTPCSPGRRGCPRPATRTSRHASCGPRSRAGSTAATNPADCVQYTRQGRLDAGQGPPDLDDERDQRAGLAVPERDRR